MLFKPEYTKKKENQNNKLFNVDFPWLWAIRNSFDAGFADILVISVSEKDWKFLPFLQSPYSSDCEVWIKCLSISPSSYSFSYSIKKVEVDEKATMCWAKAIMQSAPIKSFITHIVTIRPGSKAEYPEEIRVHRRMSKENRDFNSMLSENVV